MLCRLGTPSPSSTLTPIHRRLFRNHPAPTSIPPLSFHPLQHRPPPICVLAPYLDCFGFHSSSRTCLLLLHFKSLPIQFQLNSISPQHSSQVALAPIPEHFCPAPSSRLSSRSSISYHNPKLLHLPYSPTPHCTQVRIRISFSRSPSHLSTPFLAFSLQHPCRTCHSRLLEQNYFLGLRKRKTAVKMSGERSRSTR